MTLIATVVATVTLAAQEVASVLTPTRHRHHHHRRHRRRPDPPTFQTAIASFYDYGGSSTGACGQLVGNGVANKTLACWTRLVMCAARCSSAVVDDRGPYVPGRTFDLSVGLAQAIGFDFNAGFGPVRWRLA